MTPADYLRIVVFLMFGLTIGETAWIMRIYWGISTKTRRLLPVHVLLISVSTIMFEIEAVLQNIHRFGLELNWHAPYNLVGFALLYASLLTLRRHLTRKRRSEAPSGFEPE